MVNRVGLAEKVVLTGGCAKNRGLRKSLEDMLGTTFVDLPCDPQINGALGAALYAADAAGAKELSFGGIAEGDAAADDVTMCDASRMEPDHPLCEGCAQ